MLEAIKKQACDANLELVARGVVIYTWGSRKHGPNAYYGQIGDNE